MTLIGSLGAYFFKLSSTNSKKIISLFFTPTFYLGATLYVLSAILNILLLKVIDYTVLYPMTAITYIWSLALSNRLLGEEINKQKLIGVLLICAGVFFIARY